MKTVGIFEGKTHFSALIDQAKNGETIIVTKHGQPVAQFSAVGSDKLKTARTEAMERVLSVKAALGPGLSVRALIEEGRRP